MQVTKGGSGNATATPAPWSVRSTREAVAAPITIQSQSPSRHFDLDQLRCRGWYAGRVQEIRLRGNVVDLAVGVVIGVAFGVIVSSLLGDSIVTIVGAITGGPDFSNYYLWHSGNVQPGAAYADAKKQGAVIGYGQFLTVAVNFLIVAAVLFLVIKAINTLKRKEEAKPHTRRTSRREALDRNTRPSCDQKVDTAGIEVTRRWSDAASASGAVMRRLGRSC